MLLVGTSGLGWLLIIVAGRAASLTTILEVHPRLTLHHCHSVRCLFPRMVTKLLSATWLSWTWWSFIRIICWSAAGSITSRCTTGMSLLLAWVDAIRATRSRHVGRWIVGRALIMLVLVGLLRGFWAVWALWISTTRLDIIMLLVMMIQYTKAVIRLHWRPIMCMRLWTVTTFRLTSYHLWLAVTVCDARYVLLAATLIADYFYWTVPKRRQYRFRIHRAMLWL